MTQHEFDKPLFKDALAEVPDSEVMDVAEQAALHEYRQLKRYVDQCRENLDGIDLDDLFNAEEKLEALAHSKVLERLGYKYRSIQLESVIDQLNQDLSLLRAELNEARKKAQEDLKESHHQREMNQYEIHALAREVEILHGLVTADIQPKTEALSEPAHPSGMDMNKKASLEEIIIERLGWFGQFLSLALNALFIVLPMIILDFPWWAYLIAVLIGQLDVIGPLVFFGVSFWAMTVAVYQAQDWIVIAFYITFGLRMLLFLPVSIPGRKSQSFQ